MRQPDALSAPAALRTQRPGYRARAALILLCSTFLVFGASRDAEAAPCATSGPSGGSYTVTVCLTSPAGGATLSGRSTIKATASVSGQAPGIKKLVFRLNGSYVLSDFAAPYEFGLPTERWADGSRTLSVAAHMGTGFVSTAASIGVTLSNGVVTPPSPTPTFTPRSGTSPDPGRPLVVAAVGDGADGTTRADGVIQLIDSWNPNLFQYLGDVYENGSYTEMVNWYGDPGSRWGRFRDFTNPALANHEYGAGPGAPGYAAYWGMPPNHYAVDAGGWRIIVLDTTEQFNQRNPGTGQYVWLQQELAANADECVMVIGHHPRFSVGGAQDNAGLAPLWSVMADGGAEMYLSGDSHNYQHWRPLDASGALDPGGLTQFVIGTGGHGMYRFARTDERLADGFDAPQGFGAMRLELNPEGAAFLFSRSNGTLEDWGSIPCRGTPPDTAAPTAPTDPSATVTSGGVDLAWESSTDNVGVTGYRVYRDGALHASTGPTTRYRDTNVQAGSTYRYEIRGIDAAGNMSPPSTPVDATLPSTVFGDDFELGNLSRWSAVSGLVVQQQHVNEGAWAARATTNGGPPSFARKTLTNQSELVVTSDFKVIRRSTEANLLTLQSGGGGGLARLFLDPSGRVAVRNAVLGRNFTSSAVPTSGAWHEIKIRLRVAGASSEIEVWLDGVRLTELAKTTSLGTTPIGRVLLGDTISGHNFDVAFDDVNVALP
jgi:hypothetical protein